jgi:hypothetical protein
MEYKQIAKRYFFFVFCWQTWDHPRESRTLFLEFEPVTIFGIESVLAYTSSPAVLHPVGLKDT